MAGTDIIHFGNGLYGVRDLYNAWVAAGRPPINSAGRLYLPQKQAWDAYQNGTGSPADNPDEPWKYPLAHVRFAALDIDPTPARVAALSAAGLVRPYAYEPWHWQLPGIYNYPLVYSIPASAGDGSTSFEDDDMNAEQDALLKNIAAHLYGGGTSVRDDKYQGGAGTVYNRIRNIEAHLYAGGVSAQDPAYTGAVGTVYNMLKSPVFRSASAKATALPADGSTVKVSQRQDNADTNTILRGLADEIVRGVIEALAEAAPKA